MNRRERRELERKGLIEKKEPTLCLKPSQLSSAIMTGPGEEAMKHEIHQQFLEMDKTHVLDLDTMYLWTLHKEEGWGKKKLKDFYFKVFREHMRMRKFYEMDELYPERHKLKEKGIDIEAWFDSLFDEEGNFKNPDEVTL